jgi:hypothetical protein
MSSIKQLIINEFMRIACEHPPYNSTVLTAEESRDEFLRRLIAALFPESPEVDLSGFPPAPPLVQQSASVPVPEASPAKKTKKTKKTAPAKTEEAVVVVKVDDDVPPPLEKVPETEEVVVVVPVAVEAPAAETPSKKKRAPMSEEAKAAMKAKREATLAAKKAAGGEAVSPAPAESVVETSGSNAAAGAGSAPEPEAASVEVAEKVKEKKTKKPKAEKPAEDANLAKVDPTWRKHLKHADKDHAKDLEPELLKYLNALSKDDFNAKKAEEHVADFIASRVTKAVESAQADGKVEADLIVVDFNGKEYFVNPETKRVYEGEGTCDAEGNWTNYKGVGYVGMAAFADMTVDDE